jgi:DNA topoisomerase I
MVTTATASPPQVARHAGLRYVSDESPGIRRHRAGDSFRYTGPDGRPVRDAETLARIRSLVIPPGWTDVWICPIENGHLQATGRDVRGRKQYRYHPRWRAVRDADKYERLVAFARALPRIRRHVDRDLRRQGLPREKVLATVARLLEVSFIRVGNEEYAQQNSSYGLTTLRDRHVRVRGSEIRLVFRGKSGREHHVSVRSPRLARIVKRCEELPGQRLFQYVGEDGKLEPVDSQDVNEYIREASGGDFTAKDFRTWAGTVLAARALSEMQQVDSEAQAKRNVVAAVERVAAILGNTRAVCRRCYVHPAIVESYVDGTMLDGLRQRAEETMRTSLGSLTPEEAAVLALLQQRLKREARQRRRSA